MHAVYNYSGFVDLVTAYHPEDHCANAVTNGERDRLSRERGESPGATTPVNIQPADDG